MSTNSDVIVIPKNILPSNIAIEISPSRRNDSPLGKHLLFIASPDTRNVESVLNFINQYEGMVPYFTNVLAYNIINGFQPKGHFNSSNFHVPYRSISLAAVGPSYDELHSGIEALANENRDVASTDAKKALGEDIITPYPTLREPVGNFVPTWSYRFAWKNDAPSGFPNMAPRDIVLGIYEKLK